LPSEFVGQASFMTVGEIRRLVDRAKTGCGTSLLAKCCEVAGPHGADTS
jgi:hypothetical protein